MTSNKHLVRGYLAAVATLLMWSGFSLFSRLAGKSVLTPYDVYALRLITALRLPAGVDCNMHRLIGLEVLDLGTKLTGKSIEIDGPNARGKTHEVERGALLQLLHRFKPEKAADWF